MQKLSGFLRAGHQTLDKYLLLQKPFHSRGMEIFCNYSINPIARVRH